MLALFLFMFTAVAHDHSQWQAVLDKYRGEDSRVDYAGIAASGALDTYVSGLATAAAPSGKAEQMAFWVNAYNAITVDLIAKHWPLKSIRELDEGKVWTSRSFIVAGQALTLDQIEKQKLVSLGDPRVHMVLNCASLGCPPLSSKAFTADNIAHELTASTQAWLPTAGAIIDEHKQELVLSEIFKWYADEFPDSAGPPIKGVPAPMQGPLKFIAQNLPERQGRFILDGGYTYRYQPFDWKVNSR